MTDAEEPAVKGEPLPPLEELLLTTPLYEAFPVNEGNHDDIQNIAYYEGTIDAYCIGCKQQSVFAKRLPSGSSRLPTPGYRAEPYNNILDDGVFGLHLKCMRNEDHVISFIFGMVSRNLVKIGQWPSVADFQIAELGKYRKILGNDKYRELTTGVGLAAHGVGIGSFVYLRRIFEGLIDEAHATAIQDQGWDETLYSGKRMHEKITLLKDHLPEFLVENRGMYSILSKGIHELSEQECRQFFGAVRVGIELILDEKLQQEEKRNKIAQAKSALSNILKKL